MTNEKVQIIPEHSESGAAHVRRQEGHPCVPFVVENGRANPVLPTVPHAAFLLSPK